MSQALTTLVVAAGVVFLVLVLLVVRAAFRADRTGRAPAWRKIKFGFFLERLGWENHDEKEENRDE